MFNKEKSATVIRLGLAPSIALVATVFYALSMDEQIKYDNEYQKTFFKGMVVGSAAGLLNTSARILDHYGNSAKTKNQVAGAISIVISLVQMVLGIGTIYGKFAMPVAISPFMNAISSLMAAVLNWEPAPTLRDSCRVNTGRYIGLSFISSSLTCSTLSLKTGNTPAYFAASALYDANVLAECSNRIRDIYSDPTTKALNKIMIVLFTGFMSVAFTVSLIVSVLNQFMGKDINLPIAFPSFMLLMGLSFYLIAQTDLSVASKMLARDRSAERKPLIDVNTSRQDASTSREATRDKTSCFTMIRSGFSSTGRWISGIVNADATQSEAAVDGAVVRQSVQTGP